MNRPYFVYNNHVSAYSNGLVKRAKFGDKIHPIVVLAGG